MFENYELGPFFFMDLLIRVKTWFDSIIFYILKSSHITLINFFTNIIIVKLQML